MSLFTPIPEPESRLAHYRLLSPKAGVHVSPIQLGAMSIGESTWQGYMGTMNKESSMKLLDAYYDAGGNFIDTANLYQDGTSEEIIGEWAEKRGIRDRLFIATKYAHNFHLLKREEPHRILFAGGNAKSLHTSIKGSLERLRTDYIDLLYVHWWDYDTSVEEVMQSLHTLILQRKVLYLGISDAPAWVVSMANQYAKDHALTPFSVYQGAWNVLDRSFEREIIPMARAQGMALAPWNVLCGGRIRSDAEEERRAATNENGRGGAAWRRTEKEKLMSQALEKVAAEVGAKHITSVAIAYVMQKTTHVFPIIGGRKVEHLLQNIEALDISLSDEHISWIENVVQFDPGFPTNLIGNGVTYNGLWLSSGKLDKIRIEPIRPKPRSTGNEKI